MAKLPPIEKLKIIEEDFQKWFRMAYELKDYTDVDIDFIVANLPDAKLQLQEREGVPRYLFYASEFKSTIKVPPQFQDTPKLFITALGKYFVDSAKFFYKDQIRYEYVGFPSSNPGDWCKISVYKSCGDEVGNFVLSLNLEGNLVVADVGYQIFGQMMPLVSPPGMLKSFSRSTMAATGRNDLLGSVATIGYGLRCLLCSLLLIPVSVPVFGCLLPKSLLALLPKSLSVVLFYYIMLFPVLPFFIPYLNSMITGINRNRETRLYRREIAIQQDLSPIHFPVKYLNYDDFNEAFAKSHDHQIFFMQLQEVVSRMSALGESANR